MEKLKKSFFFQLIIFLFFIKTVSGQQGYQEKVVVTEVEVPVRVFYKGKPVKDLTKEDFEIYENGIKQEITSLEIVSRRISFPELKDKIFKKGRIFILIFNIFDYFDEVGKGIDYFFNNIFKENDRLFILVDNRFLNINTKKKPKELANDLKIILKKYKQIYNFNFYKAFRDLRYEADRLLLVLRGEDSRFTSQYYALFRFYKNYQRIWKEYQSQYLLPDVKFYKNLVRRINLLKGEKWAICFQQREMFPKLKNESRLDIEIRNWIAKQVEPEDQVRARYIQAMQDDLQRLLNISEYFPTDKLKNVFIEANITFHLILLKSLKPVPSQDFELTEVTKNYEDCLRRISFSTGGISLFSNKISQALVKTIEKEDFHYVLWYKPQKKEIGTKRKIEVKVKRKGVEVVYLKHFPEKAEPSIIISNFKSENKLLKFTLINYKRTSLNKELIGLIQVKIKIFDENSKIAFSGEKTLRATKDKINISLKLNKLNSGNYFVILEAFDQISKERDIFSGEIKL